MTRNFTNSMAAVAFCLGATACTEATQTSATEAEFNATVVGANMTTADGGTVVYNSDGTFEGTSRGEPLVGTWRFEGGQYCRSGRVGDFQFPDGCEPVIIDGNTVTFVGDNLTIVYTIG